VSQFTFADDDGSCTRPSDPTIGGSTEVCTGTTETYSVTDNSPNSYDWTVVGGTFTPSTTSSIDVLWSSTGQEGSVSVVENNDCTSSNSVTLDITVNSIAPSSITGKTIVAENTLNVAYSVTLDANTSYNWTVVGGTIDGQTNPTTAIAGLNAITADWGTYGLGSVSVIATKTTPGCAASDATSISITKYVVADSDAAAGGCDGNWLTDACWVSGTAPNSNESARISSGDTFSNNAKAISIDNLIIDGTLDISGAVGKLLTIGGDLTINSGGSLTGVGTVTMDGSLSSPQSEIDGTGTISVATLNITTASKTISSTAVINQTSGTMNIASGLTVTNEGSITIGGSVVGADATSVWENSTNSTLSLSNGANFMATGLFNADASGNKVVYTGATDNVLVPTVGYQNLEIESAGTISLTAAVDVNEAFTLTSGTFAMGAFDMTVADDMTYSAGTLTSTGIITLDGTANQTMSGAWSIPNLTINNTLNDADAITVSNNITISTLLTLTDGILGSGANTVTISNTATGGIAGGSTASFINGILARQTNTTGLYDFPVGESTSYKRVGITPTATGGSTYQVEPFNAAYADITSFGTGINNVSEIEYWDITRPTGTDNAQIRLYWTTRSASGIGSTVGDVADLRVSHYTGGQWEDQGNGANSGDVDNGYVESATAVTTFSPFTFGSASGDNPLPVELTYFKASMTTSKTASLLWETASELNNESFIIEKSANNTDYYAIGEVTGNGTTNSKNSYQFEDFSFEMEAYYRLKQIDYDGMYEYSDIIFLNNPLEDFNFSVYPNPIRSNQDLKINFSNTENPIVSVEIYDIFGRLILQSSTTDNSIQPIRLEGFQPGIYLLNALTSDGHTKQKRIIVRN
jgi:hypothetical protein